MGRIFSRVYQVVQKIPAGKVTTYGQIAQMINDQWLSREAGSHSAGMVDSKKIGARTVGWALHKNPTPVVVPCHRVVAANGSLHGFAQGLAKKKELLKKEGIKIRNDKIDLEKYQWKPNALMF